MFASFKNMSDVVRVLLSEVRKYWYAVHTLDMMFNQLCPYPFTHTVSCIRSCVNAFKNHNRD